MSSPLSLLTRQYVAVACQGELVVLQMADHVFPMEFDVALKLSVVMRYHAHIAKLSSGLITRGFYCVGVLTDLNAPKPQRKRFMEKLPALLQEKGLSVDTEGQLVIFKIGKLTAKIPYSTARMISQWLRVRGKEAKAKAGEKAHWSEIGNTPETVNGALVA